MKTEPFSLASVTDVCIFDTLVRVIRYDEGAAGGPTAKIRVTALQGGGNLDIELIPGRQVRLPELVRGIVIRNLAGAAITGKITYGAGDITDNSLVGTVGLDAATLTTIVNGDRPEVGVLNWNNSATLVANTPLTVFAAAANTGGAIVWAAEADDYNASAMQQTLIAKAVAPANPFDGEIVAKSVATSAITGSVWVGMRMAIPQRIAAGLGLYFISSQASGSAGQGRHCRYQLLP